MSAGNARRFAPIPRAGTSHETKQDDGPELRGVIFDMDGTLCEPQNYMFGQMRAALEIDKGTDILDHIYSLPEPQQSQAMDKVRTIEREAMSQQKPQPGLNELMTFLDSKAVLKGICTRNFDAPVNHLLTHHIPSHIKAFSPVITRDFRPPKPSPAGLLHIAHAWGIVPSADVPETAPEQRPLPLIMVGDSVDDMAAGRDAGAVTVLLRSEANAHLVDDARTDVVIDRLDDMIGLLENGLTVKN